MDVRERPAHRRGWLVTGHYQYRGFDLLMTQQLVDGQEMVVRTAREVLPIAEKAGDLPSPQPGL
jgi:hypothetical protein